MTEETPAHFRIATGSNTKKTDKTIGGEADAPAVPRCVLFEIDLMNLALTSAGKSA